MRELAPDWPAGDSDRVSVLLIERLFVEGDEELIRRLLGALAAVLKATGERGRQAFISYAERL